MKRPLLLLVLVCLYALPLLAQSAEPVPLRDAPVMVLDQGGVSVLRDPSRELTFDQAQAAAAEGRFRPLPGNLGAGYVPAAFWLHLSLLRQPDDPSLWWLEVMPPFLDHIDLYHLDPAGQVDLRIGGDLLPQTAKEEDYRGTLFKLDLSPGRHEIFLRLHTSSTLVAVLKLWQPAAFARHARASYFAYGAYFSLILTVLLFNLVNWLVTRRPVFLAYISYLALNALQWLSITGFLGAYLLPDQPRLANQALGVSLALAAALAYVFYALVLELRRYHPVLYRLTQGGILISLATALATLLGYYQTFAPWLLLTGVGALGTIPWPFRRLWRSGDLWARLLALAYLTFGLLLLLHILSTLGWLPYSDWNGYVGMASNLCHILLLHFALLLHLRRIEADHAQALEAAALARQETAVAKAAEEEQARLLAMISHEIRTPISVISASTQSLEALDAAPPPERIERYDRIRRAVSRLAVVLELVIVQARSAVARQPLARSPIEPAALTAAVLDLLEHPPPRPLELDVPPDLPTLCGDAGLLRFALLNLVDNACKYSPAGTPVRIAVRAKEVAGRPGVAWSIQDQGPGIPAGLEERIFEKYVRVSEASGKAGLGLGLYLARHIAERHGGWLRPRPHPGPGACFVCWLPSQPHAPDAPDTPP